MESEDGKESPSLGAPDVAFQNVSYAVRGSYNVFSKKRKTILHSISGEFRAGELTAIVGPSGSGKTTLLHILAGYKKNGYSGSVTINDVDRFDSTEKSSYIMQEDCFHPLLKVDEIMHICANLKLGDNYSKNAKKIRVNKILDAIGLGSSAGTLTGNLSGGQRKRLGIALELMDDPPIMFFDEPTSGLDSSSTKQCVAMLKNLARQNRAVICTLHQPSATILEMFDHLYCLAEGRCCYSGDPARVTHFLSLSGLICPPYHNPADYLLDVVGGEFGDYINILMSTIDNGKVHSWRKIMPEWGSPDNLKKRRRPCCLDHALEMINSSDPEPSSKIPRCNGVQSDKTQNAPLLSNLDSALSKASLRIESDFNASFINQLSALLRRSFLCTMRDKFHMYSRLVMHLIIGVLIGTFFIGMGEDAGRVFNNFSLLFFSTLFLAFSALQSTVISFPLEVPIIRKEYFNRWYSVAAYFTAITLADLPIQVGCAFFYCTTVYFMSGQPRELMRFVMFTFVCTIISLLAQSIGYFVGSALRVMNGVIFGPMFIMPWVMTSGYFIQKRDAPNWIQPFFTISYLRHGIEGLAASIYGYARSPLPCLSEDYCHFISPKKLLKELDMGDIDYTTNVCVILAIYALFKGLTYLVLVYQLKFKR